MIWLDQGDTQLAGKLGLPTPNSQPGILSTLRFSFMGFISLSPTPSHVLIFSKSSKHRHTGCMPVPPLGAGIVHRFITGSFRRWWTWRDWASELQSSVRPQLSFCGLLPPAGEWRTASVPPAPGLCTAVLRGCHLGYADGREDFSKPEF